MMIDDADEGCNGDDDDDDDIHALCMVTWICFSYDVLLNISCCIDDMFYSSSPL